MTGRKYSMDLRVAGFFPKRVVTAPEWLGCPAVTDVCSVSGCVSPPPADWIRHWLHNEVWLYDTPELARQVMDASGPYTVFAYRLSVVRFVDGRSEEWDWSSAASPSNLPSDYRSLGFDAVGKYMDDFAGFGCSPLSCNRMAKEYAVNSHCLLDDRDAAFVAAERFSIEKPEPGTYYVAEVLVEGRGVTATSPSPSP
jgi:hypothetical protein